MTMKHRVLGLLLGGLLVGCSNESTTPTSDASGPPPGDKTTDEDERGSVGVPPPAIGYCEKLGYKVEYAGTNESCRFPDGTTCEVWAFYEGRCGQPHSYCNTHGGTVANERRQIETYTASVAVCTLNGKTCDETTFFSTGKCE